MRRFSPFLFLIPSLSLLWFGACGDIPNDTPQKYAPKRAIDAKIAEPEAHGVKQEQPATTVPDVQASPTPTIDNHPTSFAGGSNPPGYSSGGSLPLYAGSGGGAGKNQAASNSSWVSHWNEIAIDASGQDHKPVPNELGILTTGFGEHLGPGRSSRALAIIHIAIFEAANAIDRKYSSYLGLDEVDQETSVRAAIAQAAHDTLAALFTFQAENFAPELAESLSLIPNDDAKTRGIELGKHIAQMILADRANDGSDHPEPIFNAGFTPIGTGPGYWSPDPISGLQVAMGANWSQVAPFALTSAEQFRVPPPPALTSSEYGIAYNETKTVGGDGIVTATSRTEDQTEIGIFWAYDGVPSLCAPPRLYNQIAVQIAEQKGIGFLELARLLALINVAMADAGLAIWESKYFYQFWRPVTAIREGALDGNPNTAGDVSFSPLGAPSSNTVKPNFTPPFPAYPSGHAGFGGAIFQILRKFYSENTKFTFISDELNGKTLDNAGLVRPLSPRTFDNFTEAEEENGQSRMYLGIHWAFDKTEGIAQGRKVADWVFDHLFVPLNN